MAAKEGNECARDTNNCYFEWTDRESTPVTISISSHGEVFRQGTHADFPKFEASIADKDTLGFVLAAPVKISKGLREMSMDTFKKLTLGWSCKVLLKQTSAFATVDDSGSAAQGAEVDTDSDGDELHEADLQNEDGADLEGLDMEADKPVTLLGPNEGYFDCGSDSELEGGVTSTYHGISSNKAPVNRSPVLRLMFLGLKVKERNSTVSELGSRVVRDSAS